MAVGHLTYLDLTPDQRQEGARAAREQVRKLMANPFLTADQQKILSDRVMHIDKWENGQLEVGAPPTAGALPPVIVMARTVEDLATQLEKDLSGEKDFHDQVVDAHERLTVPNIEHERLTVPTPVPQHHSVQVGDSVEVEAVLSEDEDKG
jgi:hypothetical protein